MIPHTYGVHTCCVGTIQLFRGTAPRRGSPRVRYELWNFVTHTWDEPPESINHRNNHPIHPSHRPLVRWINFTEFMRLATYNCVDPDYTAYVGWYVEE